MKKSRFFFDNRSHNGNLLPEGPPTVQPATSPRPGRAPPASPLTAATWPPVSVPTPTCLAPAMSRQTLRSSSASTATWSRTARRTPAVAEHVRRQQQSIDKLRKENEQLKSELAMETRHASVKVSTAHASRLAQLTEQGNLYTQKIAVQERNLAEIEKQMALMREKVMAQRKRMGGVNAARENQMMVQKQIRILENRLDKALVKFNEALSHNKSLREKIDNLRRERVVFDNIYRKLERELHQKKKKMANIIELSNQAYESRDQAQMEIAAIQQADAKETQEYDEQMQALGRKIEEDKKRKDMLLRENASGANGAMSMDDEANLKKKVTKGVWSIAKDKANVAASMDKVQSYEEAFNKIKAATGISDIQELVNTFIANEDQNFSLFNYVNEQNNEIENLRSNCITA